jgi:hypothetical protein
VVVLNGAAAPAAFFLHASALVCGRLLSSLRAYHRQPETIRKGFRRASQIEVLIKTVNLKTDMPPVHEALQRLESELALARQQRCTVLKLIHGYGSTGAGGDIRIAVQKRLYEMAQNGQIRACIYGENWLKSNEEAWKLLQKHPDLKNDSDVGRANRGITIVLL